MYKIEFNFLDDDGRLVKTTVEDAEPDIEVSGLISAAEEIILNEDYLPLGAPLAELRKINCVEETTTELEV